jgi:hypothetical protein
MVKFIAYPWDKEPRPIEVSDYPICLIQDAFGNRQIPLVKIINGESTETVLFYAEDSFPARQAAIRERARAK